MKCPICNKIFSPETDESSLPFCSQRCKMIDAKRWLNEEYSIETINEDELEKELLFGENQSTGNPDKNRFHT